LWIDNLEENAAMRGQEPKHKTADETKTDRAEALKMWGK